MSRAWFVCVVVSLASTAHAQEILTFDDAVVRAAESGPTIDAGRASVEAARRSVTAAGRLPDPELSVGFNDFPVTGPNAGSLTRDNFTTQKIGISQDVPNRSERRARIAIATAEADKAQASLSVSSLEARLGAAQAWIDLYFAYRRVSVINRLGTETQSLAELTRGTFAAGGSSVDETVSSAIGATRMADRLAEAAAAVTTARAALRRWIGDAADETLAVAAPTFHVDRAYLLDHLHHHPSLVAVDAEHTLADANVALARSATRPDWSWEVDYGRREPGYGDLASIGFRIGLPLFQSNRQRPIINARRADVARVEADREAVLREHTAILEQRLAEYEAVEANLKRAMDIRLPLAQQRAAADIGSHGFGTLSAAQLFAARTDALEAEIDVIDLEARLARIGAALTLEYGETDQ